MHKIPDTVRKIINKVEKNGFEIYIVGGSVRDLLMEKAPKDWDFATSALPSQIQEIFPNSFYDNKFGTVGIAAKYLGEKSDEIFEITTFRKESKYSDKRHPDEIIFAQKLEDDLKRRDFTVNAMALRVAQGKPDLIDLFGGKEDLEKKLIRAVGDPNLRFFEDALRLLRAVRFATQLKFLIEEKTFEAIKFNAPQIKRISGERIRDELFKILESEYPAEGFWVLRNAGLLKEILPEVDCGFEVEQQTPGRHHIYDVGTHALKSLETCPSKDPLVRFAALLHDVGKPTVQGKDEKGTITFYNHEVVGAHIARVIADRLHFSKEQRTKLVILVRWHQFSVDEATTSAAVRRFIRRVGVENIKDIVQVRVGDRLGGGLKEASSWRLERFMKMVEKELHPPFSVTDLAVDGDDVMKILGITPGPEVGKILEELFLEVEDGKMKNERKILLGRIEEIKKAEN